MPCLLAAIKALGLAEKPSAAENAADCRMWQLLQTDDSHFPSITVHTIPYSGPMMLKMLDRLNQAFDNLVLHYDLFKEDIVWDAKCRLSLYGSILMCIKRPLQYLLSNP